MLLKFRYNNFLEMLQCFDFNGRYYVVFEHVLLSLTYIVNAPLYLRESELVAIISQVYIYANKKILN